MKPSDIESLSFQIIDREAGDHPYAPPAWEIVRRIIHTTADFEYLKTIRIHPRAISCGLEAIRGGKPVVTDTRMAQAGIRQKELTNWGATLHCLIQDPEVVRMAAAEGITRAKAAVDQAASRMDGGIYAIGNAPTALLRLIELVKAGEARPALIIGFPVGFVNAAESKDALLELDSPFITNTGRKGGSNVAASVVNALLIMAGLCQHGNGPPRF